MSFKTGLNGSFDISMNLKWGSCFLLVSLSSISSLIILLLNTILLKLNTTKAVVYNYTFENYCLVKSIQKLSFIIQQLIHLIKNYLLSKNCNLTTVPKLQQWSLVVSKTIRALKWWENIQQSAFFLFHHHHSLVKMALNQLFLIPPHYVLKNCCIFLKR